MNRFQKRRWFAGGLTAVLAVVGGVWIGVLNMERAAEPIAPIAYVLPPVSDDVPLVSRVSSSPFLNVSTKATYVGGKACIKCHANEHASYLQTAHSKALGKIDPSAEPPAGRFHHSASGRSYRIRMQSGQMRHEEVLGDDQDGELAVSDFAVKYSIGSGRHSRSYLVETDGFLVESPITWYASKKTWAVSPGYDIPSSPGFSRPAGKGCLVCHSGRVESIDDSLHRLKIHEQTIGCESCHGPGSLHIKFWSSPSSPSADKVDHTIVNPAHLSRDLRESICSQCHLRGAATVIVRGSKLGDFRPGLPLTDFRINYQLERPSGAMKVVGHTEQMRNSRCYSQSKSLTCTTCHDPHSRPDAPSKVEFFRKKCLECHESEDSDCGLPRSKRMEENPTDNCISCHMPQVDTDIPHFAFTHHRIGLNHKKRYEKNRAPPGRLIAMGDVSNVSRLDQQRCLGLAYLEFSTSCGDGNGNEYRRRAFAILEGVHATGLRDAAVLSGLAQMHWEHGSEKCTTLATEALKQKKCSPSARANALVVLGETQLRSGNFEQAVATFEKLVRHRRNPQDWNFLGLSRLGNNDGNGAVLAFQNAASIRPDWPDTQMNLSNAYEKIGKMDLSRQHAELAKRLSRLLERKSKSKSGNGRNANPGDER